MVTQAVEREQGLFLRAVVLSKRTSLLGLHIFALAEFWLFSQVIKVWTYCTAQTPKVKQKDACPAHLYLQNQLVQPSIITHTLPSTRRGGRAQQWLPGSCKGLKATPHHLHQLAACETPARHSAPVLCLLPTCRAIPGSPAPEWGDRCVLSKSEPHRCLLLSLLLGSKYLQCQLFEVK